MQRHLWTEGNGDRGGKKKRQEPLTFSGSVVLSYLDSNQDKLIQSQMCYRYTIGQSRFSGFLTLSKAVAKVLTFRKLTKSFFHFCLQTKSEG